MFIVLVSFLKPLGKKVGNSASDSKSVQENKGCAKEHEAEQVSKANPKVISDKILAVFSF